MVIEKLPEGEWHLAVRDAAGALVFAARTEPDGTAFWTGGLVDRIKEVERQNADLQAANNRYLERARSAEASLAIHREDTASEWAAYFQETVDREG